MIRNDSHIDILGLGAVAVDDLIYVDSYPPRDTKMPVQRQERHCGGLTATALVTAARLGSNCAYAGVLGYDELSEFAIERMRQEGISLSHLVRRDQARPIHSIIIVDEVRKTRNIFFDRHGVVGADPDLPEPDVIRSARALLIDNFGIEGMIRAARIAREAGIPVVADFESDDAPRFSELLALVDHLIVSRDFGEKMTGEKDPARAAQKLWAQGRQVVIVTNGPEGSTYLDASPCDSPKHQPAFPVSVVDTTGCGDVFHGAYASALVRRLPLAERVRFASATAALKATQRGGQAGIPSRSGVENFLDRGSSR